MHGKEVGLECKSWCGNTSLRGAYIELPRAICNPSGIPNKGQKSYATKWLENRYKDLVANHLPVRWIPESVILEGMFMINVSPLRSHHT